VFDETLDADRLRPEGCRACGVRSGEAILQLPDAAPVLTPGLVRVLARILTKAGRAQGLGPIREPAAPEALAS
jgi:hypothetical protein